LAPPPPSSTLFPYTTLFRSDFDALRFEQVDEALELLLRGLDEEPRVSATGEQWIETSRLGRQVADHRHVAGWRGGALEATDDDRSEEHTSELQSRSDLVCRL